MLLYHGTAYDRSFTGDGDVNLVGSGELGTNAFYLSYTFEEAELRAYLNANQGFGSHADTRVLSFDLNTDGLEILDFGDFSKEWLDFVYTHKCNTTPDIIIGGLVDEMGRNPGLLSRWISERKKVDNIDSLASQFTDSVVHQLKNDIKLQVAIKTEKGVNALKFLRSTDV